MAWAIFVAKIEPTLKGRAMRLLARREHSREELRRKLAAHANEGEDVNGVLDDLAQKGWLSDARYAEQAARVKARRYGPLKVVHYLKSRGLADELIAAGMQAAAAGEAASSLESIWRSRFRDPPADEKEKARQVRFLQGRGFPLEEIFRFLRELRS